MTKRKLLELCNKLFKDEITKDEILKLKDLSDEEIDIVLKSKDKSYTIELLKNSNFRNLSKNTQQELLQIFNSCEDIYGKAIYIIKVATNKNAISSGNVVELVRIISEAQGINQAHNASIVACDYNAISTGQVAELAKIISECRYEEQLEIACHAARNIHIAKSGKIVEIVKLIAQANDKRAALRIFYNMVNLSKDISIESSLANGTIDSVDFWQVFSDDSEAALKLLNSFNINDEILPEMIITNEKNNHNTNKK